MKYYAGIGARDTPREILPLMTEIGHHLNDEGWILRSGGADGADLAFEAGCLDEGKKEIYLPWKGFNKSKSSLFQVSEDALSLAKEFHPYWHKLSRSSRLLQARNGYQLLGLDLNTPAQIVICYTTGGKIKGGTGQALRIAKSPNYNIPVLNLGTPNLDLRIDAIKELIEEMTSSKQLKFNL